MNSAERLVEHRKSNKTCWLVLTNCSPYPDFPYVRWALRHLAGLPASRGRIRQRFGSHFALLKCPLESSIFTSSKVELEVQNAGNWIVRGYVFDPGAKASK